MGRTSVRWFEMSGRIGVVAFSVCVGACSGSSSQDGADGGAGSNPSSSNGTSDTGGGTAGSSAGGGTTSDGGSSGAGGPDAAALADGGGGDDDSSPCPDAAPCFEWKTLKVGAGGYLTGMDMSPDGSTRLVRTDTYGAYRWEASSSTWTQLVKSTSMPAELIGVGNNAGVYEIAVAPSQPTRIYMTYAPDGTHGFVFRSDDVGTSWSKTGFAAQTVDANGSFRTNGQKMAVDPANPDVVYVGTAQNGIFATGDGGATWKAVTAIPASTIDTSSMAYQGNPGIAFDATSGTSGGKTKVLYASAHGSGIYRSADAGASWTKLSGPTGVSHARVASDGGYYATSDDGASVWRYQNGALTNITPSSDAWSTIVVDPHDPARIIAVRAGGFLDISHDRGATWSGVIFGSGAPGRIATDIPWLAWTNESYMSVGDMMLDPVKTDRLWFAEGIGCWYTDVPDVATNPTQTTYTSQSTGIEQLVANDIAAPPGGDVLLGSWDRPVFTIDDPDTYPATHGPNNQNAIIAGWSLDWASSDPTFIVGLMDFWGHEESATSSDSGKTWTLLPSYPNKNVIGGSIAASTPTNFVLSPSDNSAAYYTKDAGRTWTVLPIAGVPTSGTTGWGFAYYLDRRIVAADRVTPNTFYAYNSSVGMFRSTTGGDTWTAGSTGEIAAFSGYNAQLRSVPANAGHLFFTSGPQSGTHPSATSFMRSKDGGDTWTAVPGVLEVITFGFGKAAPGASYPTIFIAGWVNGTYGVYRSDDDAGTWTSLGAYPLDSLDAIKTIDGDKNTYGKVYVGFSGSGYAYGQIAP